MNSKDSDPQEFWNGLMPYIGGIQRTLVGSRYILGTGNDEDMLILVEDLGEAAEFLRRKQWEAESEQYETSGNSFLSFRAGDRNALITSDQTFFCDFARASEVCKYLAHCEAVRPYILDRGVRIALHKIVRDGAGWDAV